MLKPIFVSALAVLLVAQPASARSHCHGRGSRHWTPYHHVDRRHARFPAGGIPITAGSDAIRVNAVGQVISSPTPVIRKERNFRERARRDLAKQRASQPGTPAQP